MHLGNAIRILSLGSLVSNSLAAFLVESVNVPASWRVVDEQPRPNHLLSLQLGLKQQNLEEMVTGLYAVSDPDSDLYGEHYQHHEVLDLIKPDVKDHEKVMSWLQDTEGVLNVHSDGLWIDFKLSLETANKILNADFKWYENVENGARRLRTTQYSVPDQVAHAVDLIVPTTYFNSGNLNRKPTSTERTSSIMERTGTRIARDTDKPSCTPIFSPQCIKQTYNIDSYTANPRCGSRIGFGNFLNQTALYKDLFQYEKLFNISKQSFDVISINGGTNNQKRRGGDLAEAGLDAQTILGVASGLPLVGFFTGGHGPFITNPDEDFNYDEPFLTYYRYLLNQPNDKLPQVISHSYSDDEYGVPPKYAARVCNTMAAIGMRGITILHSSGDDGVGRGCVNHEKKAQYSPHFPPSCPYITAVGGTQNNPDSTLAHDVAWSRSSGGFSNYFSRPDYQNAAIKAYFKKHVSAKTQKYIDPYINSKGRGIPDISAHSAGASVYRVVLEGKRAVSGGTSAATPVWAGIIALLNDARLCKNQSSLGFINPLLYKRGHKALRDIKKGGSTGCNGDFGTGKKIPFASWNATEGWDPVTGLGTPNFQKLRSLVLSLP